MEQPSVDVTVPLDAGAGAGAGALIAGAGIALAAIALSHDAHAQPMPADVPMLNSLLTAEWGLIHAYDAIAGILASPPAGDPAAALAPSLLAMCLHFQSQHRDHASRLIAMIQADGGAPVAEASVLFNQPVGFTPTVTNALKLAVNTEKGAAIAYAASIRGPASQSASLTLAAIGGVESQHFVVLYLLALGLFTPTTLTARMGTTIVPQSFVVAVGSGTTGLESVMDYAYT